MRRAAAGARHRGLRPALRGGAGRLRPPPQDAPPLARGTWSSRRPSPRPASRRPPAPRSCRSTDGSGWPGGSPGRTEPELGPAGMRPERSPEQHGRGRRPRRSSPCPSRSPGCARTATTCSTRRWSLSISPTPCPSPAEPARRRRRHRRRGPDLTVSLRHRSDETGWPWARVPVEPDNLVRRALEAVGRTRVDPPGQADSSRCRARRRFGRRRRRPPVGRVRTEVELAASLGADVPFCLRRWAGPGRRHRRGRRTTAVRGAHLHPPRPSLRHGHRRRLPGLGRARLASGPRGPERRARRTTSRRPRSQLEPRLARVEGRARGRQRSAPAAGGERVDLVRRGRRRDDRGRPTRATAGCEVGAERGLLVEVTTTPRP